MSEQGSFEWYQQRYGKITSSRLIKTLMEGHVHTLNKLLDRIRHENAASEDEMRADWERDMQLGDSVAAMAWGRHHEPIALKQYEFSRDVSVMRPSFVIHPDFPYVGDSTDFIEMNAGTPYWAGEVKCPFHSDNHRWTLRHGMPPQHEHQVQLHMEVHQLVNAKFISYDPRHPVASDQMRVILVTRHETWAQRFKERATEFHHHITKGTRFEHKTGGVKDGIPSMF